VKGVGPKTCHKFGVSESHLVAMATISAVSSAKYAVGTNKYFGVEDIIKQL
jgi:hypothetical protein